MKVTRVEDYMQAMKERFPNLPEATIKKIIKEGCHKMLHHTVNKEPVNLIQRMIPFKLLIYKSGRNRIFKKDESVK